MEFNLLEIRNFMPLGHVKLDLKKSGTVLIDGFNESGKSAVFEALLWCLYGRALRSRGKDEIVNLFNSGGCEVHVNYTFNNASIDIWRYRKHVVNGNSIVILVDGNSYPPDEIRSILPIPYEVFVQVFLLSQDMPYRFSALSDRERKSLFEELIGTGLLASCVKSVELQITGFKTEIRRIEGQLTTVQAVIAEQEVTRNNLLKSRSDRVDELVGVNRALAASITRNDELRAALQVDLDRYIKEGQVLKTRQSGLQSQSTVSSILIGADEKSIERLKLSKFQLLKGESDYGSCPTCNRSISKDELKSVTGAFDGDISRAESQLLTNTNKLTEINTELRSVNNLITVTKRSIGELNSKIVEIDRSLNYDRRRSAEILIEVRQLQELSDHSGGMLRDLDTSIESNRMNLSDLLGVLNGIKTEMQTLEYLITAFSNLRSLSLQSALDSLNEYLAVLSKSIFTDPNRIIQILPETELKSGDLTDSLSIQVDARSVMDYRALSDGGKRRVDVVLQLALRLLAEDLYRVKSNVIFIDEIFDKLDHDGLDRVIEVVTNLNIDSVFLISHLDSLKYSILNRMTASKTTDGISSLA